MGLVIKTLMREKVYMKIFVKLIRIAILSLSFGIWLFYMLVSSDVPPVYTSNDLYIFKTVYLIILCAGISDFVICTVKKYRSGYFTMCMELLILGLWFVSFGGVNILICGTETKSILLGGIAVIAIHIILQTVNVMRLGNDK